MLSSGLRDLGSTGVFGITLIEGTNNPPPEGSVCGLEEGTSLGRLESPLTATETPLGPSELV